MHASNIATEYMITHTWNNDTVLAYLSYHMYSTTQTIAQVCKQHHLRIFAYYMQAMYACITLHAI